MSELVSVEDLEQLKDIMEDEFDMLIGMFVDDSSTLIQTIKTTAAEKDADALRVASHTLKGSSSNMCVQSISNLCAEIENKAKENNLTGVDALISELNAIHPQVVDILKNF